jgi:acyl carrier protein phosphodiesterase
MPKILPVRLVEQPQPLHHVSSVRRVVGMPESFTARLLLLRRPDGSVEPYLPFIEYQLTYWRLSRSWQNNAARALGLFWDFCVVHADKGWKPQDMLRQFAMTLLEGTTIAIAIRSPRR